MHLPGLVGTMIYLLNLENLILEINMDVVLIKSTTNFYQTASNGSYWMIVVVRTSRNTQFPGEIGFQLVEVEFIVWNFITTA